MQLFFVMPSPFWEPVEDAHQRLLHHMTRPLDNNEVETDPNKWTGVLCVAAFKMAVELGEAGMALLLDARLPHYLTLPDTPSEHKTLLHGARIYHRKVGTPCDGRIVVVG